MASDLIPVIYSAKTGGVRRWFTFFDNNETDAHALAVKPGEGEALLMLTRAEYGPLPLLQEKVTKHCGIDPKDHRYVAVDDKGDVTEVHCGIDEAFCGDFVKGCTLHAHAEAASGWKLQDGQFVKPIDEEPSAATLAKQDLMVALLPAIHVIPK